MNAQMEHTRTYTPNIKGKNMVQEDIEIAKTCYEIGPATQ